MYSGYQALAGVYDCLNREIDYGRWSAFLEACFDRFLPARPRIVLDLACGTGRMTFPLADRGYDMIGIDGSEDMLAEAYRKSTERTIRLLDEAGTDELPAGVTTPLFLCQDMRSFELYGTVDAAVCCLDSINYLRKPTDCQKTFRRVYDALTHGGVFVFDINTPQKLRALDGQVFLDETDDTYCVWRAQFAEKKRLCFYGMDIFQREGEHWLRSFEEHVEYAYEPEELTAWLYDAGFTDVRQYGDLRMHAPEPDEQRIYFSAKKE